MKKNDTLLVIILFIILVIGTVLFTMRTKQIQNGNFTIVSDSEIDR